MNNTLSPAEFSSYREMRQRFMWMEIKKKTTTHLYYLKSQHVLMWLIYLEV